MFDSSYISNNFFVNISQLIIEKQREFLKYYIAQLMEKSDYSKNNKEYKEIVDKCNILTEEIDMVSEEMVCVKELRQLTNLVEANDLKLVTKSKWIMKENRWLQTQVKDFQQKVFQLEKERIKLDAERNFKLNFYKMRNLQSSFSFDEEIEMWDVTFSESSNTYEPQEIFSIDITPFCNIIKENLLEWKNDLAIIWCKNILTFFRKRDGDMSNNVAHLYSFIGRIYKLNKQYEQGKVYFEKAIHIQESNKFNENEKGINLTFLGSLYEKENKYIEAEIYYKEALKCRESVLGIFHPDIADLYCKLGRVYNRLGNWQMSIDHYLTILASLEHIYDKMDSQLLHSYLDLGDNYIGLKNQDRAHFYILQNAKLILQKRGYDKNIIPPFKNLLNKNDKNINVNKISNLMSVYGHAQRCCSKELLKTMSKFYTVFNYTESVFLLREWCESSHFPYNVIEYTDDFYIEKIKVKKEKIQRASSTESRSSFQLAKKNLRNLIKNPFETVRRILPAEHVIDK